ncbi:MAG: hypothetical protein ABI675_03140 [Chitinophagaceae bacterium]
MKKLAIVTSAAFLMFTAVLNAQTDSTKSATDPATQPATTEKPASKDKYNNWSADTYKMQPMPEALTTQKIFPVLGKYQLTDKEGASSTVTVSLDPENKGLIWIEGLPQGKIKATLRKSPATYKIPVQPLEGEVIPAPEVTDTKVAKNTKKVKEIKAKELPEGVLIYDKDANLLNVCIGCTYKVEDPATAFMTTEPATTDVEKTEKKATKSSKKAVAKVTKVKPVLYSGNKIIETTAAVSAQ